MSTELRQRFDDALRQRQLLTHPFYRRWEAGELTGAELTSYAEQYRFFEAMMPSFLETLIDQLDDGSPRELVRANLRDEVSTPSHLELFDRFAQHYGAKDVEASPAMTRLLAAYDTVLERGPVAALAGLQAYESQGAAIADSKGDGLAAYYGASDESLGFWREHGSVEADHAAWTFSAMESLECDLDVVVDGARAVANAWWSFLDERDAFGADLVTA